MNDDGDKLDQMLLAERVIGCAMRDVAMLERLVRAGVSSHEFENEKHRALWQAALACFERYGAADSAIVGDHLQRTNGWKPDEAKTWIGEAMRSSWASVDDETLGAYAERLRHGAAMRRMKKLAERIDRMAADGSEAAAIAAEVEGELLSIVSGSSPRRAHDAESLASEFSSELMREEEKVERIATGLGVIDQAMRGGARRGSVLLVGADTGVGKTTFGTHIALTMARAGVPLVFFTFETKAKRIFSGLVEMHARRRADRSNPSAVSALLHHASEVGSLPLWVDDSESMTVEELASKVHGHVKRNGVRVVFVDYVQDLERSTRHTRDDLNFAHISKVLRRMAARYNVLVVGFAQLADTREAQMKAKNYAGPTEADIAYTRQFAKDASYIVMLDRMKLADDPALRNLTRVRLVKNRAESTLTTGWMRYDPATTTLSPADERGRENVPVTIDDDPFGV